MNLVLIYDLLSESAIAPCSLQLLLDQKLYTVNVSNKSIMIGLHSIAVSIVPPSIITKWLFIFEIHIPSYYCIRN